MTFLKALKQSAFAFVGLSTLIVILLILSSLLFYFTYNQVSASNNAMSVTSTLVSQSVGQKVDRNFYERFGDVQAFAYNHLAVATAERDTVAPGLQQFINTMTSYYVLYDLMILCDRSGTVLAVNTIDRNGKSISSAKLIGKSYNNEDWFKICTTGSGPDGGAWFSDFMLNADVASVYQTAGEGMAYAAPIRNAEGAIVGVWYNYASWSEVTDGIRQEAETNLLTDHPGAFIVMTNALGEIISAADKKLMGRKLNLDHNAALIDGQFFGDLALDGYIHNTSTSTGAYTFPGKNWNTITFIPKEELSWAVFFSKKNLLVVSISIAIFALVIIYVYYFFRTKILVRINRIKNLQHQLSDGEMIDIRTDDNQHPDEFGQMLTSLTSLAANLKKKAAFADEISKGNLNATIGDLNDKDHLGKSLVNMRDQLQVSREADAQRTWSTEGLAQIGIVLRTVTSSQELYAEIIKFIVRYLDANQGGLFLMHEQDGEEKIVLKASYAYDKRKFLEKTIEVGNGLIGQCVLEKSTIYLTDIPKNYVNITSGLGAANPSVLLIVPLKVNDIVYGVFEVASFKKMASYKIELAEKLAETVAASISTIVTNEKTKELLEQLQQQTEEMKSQEEEMRQNMEELSATQEEMLRKEKGYIEQIKELQRVSV
jgi:HAMP domain-containing protein/putative methionine-R-sulfoxide reductase with GAF domain